MAGQSHPSQLIITQVFDDGSLLPDEHNSDCQWALAKRVISDVYDEISVELARSCPCLCSWKFLAFAALITGCSGIFNIGLAVLGQKIIDVPFIDIFISLAVFEFGSALIAGVIFWAWMLTKHDSRRSRGQRIDDVLDAEQDTSLLGADSAA